MMLFRIILALIILSCISCANNQPQSNNELIYINKKGAICWKANNKEVALFGANYNLASASDYRAAGYITENRKELIDQDMAHFARMGWDGLRICLWGDWENCDKEGNLIINDHLDLMDYLISKAKERNIYILFTPVTTYSSLWPDAINDTSTVKGFSKYYNRDELGTDTNAIAAQVNYLKQILNHINPYTGIAIKNEPNILFIEMINEPLHHSDDITGSVKYINTLVDAVKSTGCEKILFHNVTQNMRIAPAIKVSKIDGVSFGMYPAGLVSGKTLKGNLLRTVDDYPVMHNKNLKGLPRLVYEFDEADSYTPYMYPAMTRTFRSAGAQFVAMFSYDMLATAPYNLGWQTHLMNMVYYPQKAIGGIISAEMMDVLPRMKNYGFYPENTVFEPFMVSYEDNTSEMNTAQKFIYANNTVSKPVNINELKKIVGYGSSSVVKYEGQGIYFLDKIEKDIWRLEVYPDAKIISEPFTLPKPDKIVSMLVYNKWPMIINLPGLGTEFNIIPINKDNNYSCQAKNSTFLITPGIYILTPERTIGIEKLPEKIGEVNLTEFICPKQKNLPYKLVVKAQKEYISNEPINISVEIIPNNVEEVALNVSNVNNNEHSYKIPMKYISGYTYSSTIPAERSIEGTYHFNISISKNGKIFSFPSIPKESQFSWIIEEENIWRFRVTYHNSPLILFNPKEEIEDIAFTRIGDGIRWGIYDTIFSEKNEILFRLYYPLSYDKELEDYTMSVTVKDKINNRGDEIKTAKGIELNAQAELDGQETFVTLIEADGTSWSTKIILKKDTENIFIPIDQFKIAKGVKLPLGFPERWNYWLEPAQGRGTKGDHMHLDKVEKLQISLRTSVNKVSDSDPWIEIGSVCLIFK